MVEIYDYDGKNTLLSKTSAYVNIFDIDDVKAFARIDDTSLSGFDSQNDSILSALVDASIDKFEQMTGRRLLENVFTQSYNMLHSFDYANVQLPHSDVVVSSVSFYEQDNTQVPLLSSEYDVDEAKGQIQIYADVTQPSTLRKFNNFVVLYTAAMFEDATEVSDDIKTAIKQQVSHWYENRQSVSDINTSYVTDSAKLTYSRYKRRIR